MTREQYESLPLAELKEIAKARGMKGTSAMKKKDLIDRMLEKDKEAGAQKEREQAERGEHTERAGHAEHCLLYTSRPFVSGGPDRDRPGNTTDSACRDAG